MCEVQMRYGGYKLPVLLLFCTIVGDRDRISVNWKRGKASRRIFREDSAEYRKIHVDQCDINAAYLNAWHLVSRKTVLK